MKYFSMFSGIGGFENGIGDKAECVGFSEIDKYAIQTYLKHFPEHKNYGDATKINPREIPDFDMLCGGFPCQAFSIAGKRRGFEDTRGTLFFDIARIIEVKRPKIILLENVKGLLNHNQGQTFKVIIQTLSELGYDIQWMVLNSKFFGVPQNRERVFIIGNLRGESRPEILPFRRSNRFNIEKDDQGNDIAHTIQTSDKHRGSYILHNVYGGFGEGIREQKEISPTIRTPKGGGHLPMIAIPVLTPDRENKRQNGRRFKEDGDESFTLTKTDVHGVMTISNSVTPDAYLTRGERNRDENGKAILTSMNERRIRRLTPCECERLQSFPDNWTEGVSDTQRYKQLGNAVTVNVIEAIMEELI